MDAANGAATATISNGGTSVAPTDRTAGDTLVGRNITDHTAPDPTALRECHFGEQQHPRQRCEQAGEKSALVGHGAIIAARRGEKEGPRRPFRKRRQAHHLNARAAPLVPGGGKPITHTDPLRWFLCGKPDAAPVAHSAHKKRPRRRAGLRGSSSCTDRIPDWLHSVGKARSQGKQSVKARCGCVALWAVAAFAFWPSDERRSFTAALAAAYH